MEMSQHAFFDSPKHFFIKSTQSAILMQHIKGNPFNTLKQVSSATKVEVFTNKFLNSLT